MWQDLIVQAIQRIEQHQMMQQQEMLNSITAQQQATASQQQAIQRVEAKLAKQEEIQSQLLRQQEQLHQMTLQQANKIPKEVAHLRNKQDQLADEQDILQSMLMKESGVFRSPPVMSPALSVSRTPSSTHPSILWPGFSPPQFPTPQFPTKPPAIRASSCPPAPILTQLPEYDDELASMLSDNYVSELSDVMDDCLLSGAVESSSVMALQEGQGQSLLTSASQPSASDTQLSALLAGGGCSPELANIDKLPPPEVGGGCPPQLTSVDELPHPAQVGGGCPPQLTNVDQPSHSGQVSSVTNHRNVKKSAAQVVQDHPELWLVANVGTSAVKLARHSFFGDEVLKASSLTGKNGPP